jgi:transcriptional regulator with XRE-family HTH domain
MERKNEQLVAAFAKVLKDRRKAAGLSQEELAFRADLSMSYISLLETKNRQPTLTVMEVLARELGLSLSELVADIDIENVKRGRTVASRDVKP